MYTGKVFGLGLSRTGTTSMHVASVLLGFSSIHYPLCYRNLAVHWLLGNFSPDVTRPFQCYFDLPTPVYFREFDRTHEDCKFILTYRDATSWIESVEFIYRKSWKLPKSPKTPWRHCISAACYGTIYFDRQRFLDVYRRHNDSVVDYFSSRPGALLTIDLSAEFNGWKILAEFLGVDAPRSPFPRVREPDLGSLSWVGSAEISAKKAILQQRLSLV